MPAVELIDIAIRYRRKNGVFRTESYWPLKNISLQVMQGETLGIIGRNGVGKSTLLQLLAGILSPDRGEIINHVERTSLLSLQVGFVPFLSGRINAIMSGMLLGFRRKEMLRLMPEVIRFSELESFIDQPVRTYSAGMRARLGFSIAHHLNPDLLLIDEVLGVGDASFREKSSAVIREKICSNQSVVLVSHNPAVLRELCDRVIWLREGRVHQEGAPAQVLQEYIGAVSSKKQ
ncbi:ABC transporter ATP-binding protein [Thiolapillus brandeum]|uniref:Lipopolysaccharide transporter ATP-binding protein n=1 Tax=Thiolapillus brandeum TaxID=1076588 RepID=A0A7U6GIJ0_9GAMM|nr:ATP-binding cassette domain-containing protein [Thiolapillus brandeum]BAO44264.1 lipopolysaccharide transporter ATP-binding protein [Thiolapillus brandeum]